MSIWSLASAGTFGVIALAHSVLGERLLLGPLFRSGAFAGHPLGTRFAGRTMRFAWHLTSLTWVAVGATLLAPGALSAIVVTLGVGSGLYVALTSRGQHLAWPLFLLAGLSAQLARAPVSAEATAALGTLVAVVLSAIALLHVYWAGGGRISFASVIPEVNGKRLFSPSRGLTLLVAVAVMSLAGTAIVAGGALIAPPAFARWAAAIAALVFLARTFGDGRSVGVLKRVRGTTFARWDDRLYTPLSFALSAGFLVLAAG